MQTDLASAVPAGGFSFGIITNNVAAFVRALEDVVDLTIVANPKVLTANEQLGRVIVGREDGYLTTTVTETTSVQIGGLHRYRHADPLPARSSATTATSAWTSTPRTAAAA